MKYLAIITLIFPLIFSCESSKKIDPVNFGLKITVLNEKGEPIKNAKCVTFKDPYDKLKNINILDSSVTDGNGICYLKNINIDERYYLNCTFMELGSNDFLNNASSLQSFVFESVDTNLYVILRLNTNYLLTSGFTEQEWVWKDSEQMCDSCEKSTRIKFFSTNIVNINSKCLDSILISNYSFKNNENVLQTFFDNASDINKSNILNSNPGSYGITFINFDTFELRSHGCETITTKRFERKK